MADWHAQTIPAVLAALGSSAEAGLPEAEAARRLAQHGPNALVERGGRSPWRILWEQFTATMVLILLAAAVLSAVLLKWTEAVSILAIVVLFGGLGFLQEYRAERAIAALKQLAVPSVRVRRGGALREISARELVPGDVVVLEAGNVIPADLRVLEAANLRQPAQPTGLDEVAVAGTDRVAIDALRFDLGTAPSFNGVVDPADNRAFRHKRLDQQQQQRAAQGLMKFSPGCEIQSTTVNRVPRVLGIC